MADTPRPLVLVPACQRMVGDHPSHTVGEKYIEAVRLAGGLPLVVPAAAGEDLDVLLTLADGVFLTGSPSNVHPSHFHEPVHDPRLPLDPQRDAWTLPLIPLALERGVPLLAVCRGFQEMNVALGGSLHQAVHEQPGLRDHREDDSQPLERQYAPAHAVRVAPGGRLAEVLAGMLGDADEIMVNSLHGQGVNRLAPGLRVEGTAPDGVIEAFSHPDAPAYNLGVQWHPEWQAAGNPVSMALLASFGAACRLRQAGKTSRHR